MKWLSGLLFLSILGLQEDPANTEMELVKTNSHPFYTYQKTGFKLKMDGKILNPLNYRLTVKGHAKYFRIDSQLRIIAFNTNRIKIAIKSRNGGEELKTFKRYPKPNPYFSKSWDTLDNCEKPLIDKKEAFFAYRHYSHYKLLGDTIPEIDLQTFEGKKVNKESFLGKTTFMNFWKYGCLPCIEEIPFLNRLKKDFKVDDKVQFISFFTDSIFQKGNNQKIYEFTGLSNVDSGRAQPFKVKFNFTQVPNTAPLHEKFGVCGYPTNMIIDEEGIIRDISVGASLDSALNHQLMRRFKRRLKEVKRE